MQQGLLRSMETCLIVFLLSVFYLLSMQPIKEVSYTLNHGTHIKDLKIVATPKKLNMALC